MMQGVREPERERERERERVRGRQDGKERRPLREISVAANES